MHLSSTLLLWSMLPLAFGICLDFYLIARLIIANAVMCGVDFAIRVQSRCATIGALPRFFDP